MTSTSAPRNLSRTKDRTPLIVRLAAAIVVFAAVTVGAALVSASLFEEAKQERIAVEDSGEIIVDSVYSDRIASGLDADYDRTPYQQIAAGFAEDPVYVDDYAAWSVTDADLEAIRSEVEGLDDPIFVAFLTTSDLDAADGDLDLAAARISRELPTQTGTVLTFDSILEGSAEKGIDREVYRHQPDTDFDETVSGEALAWVRALKTVTPDEPYTDTEYVADPGNEQDPRDLAYHPGSAIAGATIGLVLGAGAAAVAVPLIVWIRQRRAGQSPSGMTKPAENRARTKEGNRR
ncbi:MULTISPECIES: hypothetical protein [unclassified Brevibacterium]|uniref:hypothetical protein n=1 Tax=unclassified Brevibacterium TaxID=2614124 RepID=UPI0010F571EA|nr:MULTISPECIES: hypothetical protein [unclassified Brevibacterium]MCM1013431.1 hypothetical protein [Brevibacterium sp. XM4083]